MTNKPAGLPPWRTVAFKLSALTSALVLVVIGLMAESLFVQAEQGLIAEMSVRGRFFALAVREAITPRVDAFQLHFQVEQMRREKAVVQAAVLDAQGQVLSHSDPEAIGSRPRDPFTQAALRAPEPSLQRASGGGYDLAVPVMLGAKRVGTVRLGFDQSSLREALAGTRRRIAFVAAVSIVAAVLGTVLIVGWMMRPLPRLAAAAGEVARGNFSVQVEWRSRDEIGQLARAFNEMTIANALLFKGIREEKEKIETIFNATVEGLVWTDKGGRVLLMNPAARDLLACRDRAAATLAEATRDFKPAPALEDILAGRRRAMSFDLVRQEPKLLILTGVADRLGGAGGADAGFLFIFRDGTLERRGESLARNFLSIVSHKLRTPLAVVLGYMEVLQGAGLEGFPADALKRMRLEEEKLARLVEKLLVFTAVQNPESIVLDRAECSVPEVVAAARKAVPVPAGGELFVDEEALKALPKFKADFTLVKESLANLLENAFKFNPAARKTARLTVSAEGGLMRFSVVDDGPGVPSEEQPKLFRRFYQIDPDFTGQIPGMGLGLAFVKSVAEAHGGGAGLRSEPGKGSEFFFFFPAGA